MAPMYKIFLQDQDYLLIKLTEEDYYRHYTFLFSRPVREIIKPENPTDEDSQEYFYVPVRDLGSIVSTCRQYHLQLAVSRSAYERYLKIRELYKQQMEIRSHLLDKKFRYDNFDGLLKEKLRSFQTVGTYFIENIRRAVIGDDVGLGKTVQSIAASQEAFRIDEANFFIIICPNSVKRNWGDEIEKFTKSDYDIIDGGPSRRKNLYKTAHRLD